MERVEYARFTEELRAGLEADGRVLGLVVLGSTADGERAPDRWSDHDFFVVVTPGAQESFRSRLDWLPHSDRIALSYRETAHGGKVLYRDGHLLEFAVFSPEELPLARVNVWQALIDRERITERMADVAATTGRNSASGVPSDEWLAGQFLTSLLVGVGRYARGERLSGRQLVSSTAATHLVTLLSRRLDPPGPSHLDSLDPLRRFEQTFPSMGRDLNAILDLPSPDAARALLDLAAREMPEVLPAPAIDAVRKAIR
jgi:hypothetical protein